MTTKFEDFLTEFNETDWLQTIDEVDCTATQIWFHFYPPATDFHSLLLIAETTTILLTHASNLEN